MNRINKNRLIKLAGAKWLSVFPKSNNIRFLLYKKLLGLKHKASIHSNVMIGADHRTPKGFDKINESGIVIGKDFLVNEHTLLDTTGNLIIGNGVSIADHVSVFTHHHDIFQRKNEYHGVVIASTTKIGDGVNIGSNAMVFDSCTQIGRFASVGAGAYVRSNIPPYSIVIGNPAKIIGFKFTPDEMEAFELERYDENERYSPDKYRKVYKKYFSDAVSEINKFVKLKVF